MSSARRLPGLLLLAVGLLATAQCTKLPYEPVQILVLEVETQGAELDPDGYIATIDDEMSQAVASNGSATFEGVGAGERLLTLSGLADNCAVDGPNPRPLTIDQDAVTRARVSVTCTPVAGLLIVEAATTGTDQDPDGYTVSVDDATTRTIGTNGSVTFEGLTPGEHVVTLANVADNCRLLDGEPNPRVVTLTADASTTTTFPVQCGPRGGDLVVVAATSGTDVDPDGYTISLDEGEPTPIGTNGAITFTNLSDGEHQVTIDGLANNCSLAEGSRSRTVTITSNASAAETFFVFCGPPAGALVVDVTTTGTAVDTLYTVSVTDTLDQTRTKSLTTNGAATFDSLAAGPYQVELTGVAANCAVVIDETPNPRTIILTPGASSSTNFFVHCQPVAGSLVVDVSTSGIDPLPGGYSVVLEEVGAKPVSANGAALFEGLVAWGDAGWYEVRIGDRPDGCVADGSNPRRVRVMPGAATRASFQVVCDPGGDGPPSSITVDVRTTGDDPDPDGYTVGVTGRSPVPVATNGTATFLDLEPGQVEVRIDGVARNCEVEGAESRLITVPPDVRVVVRFSVECDPLTDPPGPRGDGTLMVKVRTTGPGPVDGGFQITVREIGPDTVTLAAGENRVYEDLVEGTYTVEVIGMPGNCSLDGGAVRPTEIGRGELRVVWLWFDCR